MDDEAKEFWGAFETETGEKVEARSEGNWIHGIGPTREGRGLLILTDKSFRFKYVPDTIRPFMSSRMTSDSADRAEFTVERARHRLRARAEARLLRAAFPAHFPTLLVCRTRRRWREDIRVLGRPLERPHRRAGKGLARCGYSRPLRPTCSYSCHSAFFSWSCGFWDLSARTRWVVTSMSRLSSGSSCSSFHW